MKLLRAMVEDQLSYRLKEEFKFLKDNKLKTELREHNKIISWYLILRKVYLEQPKDQELLMKTNVNTIPPQRLKLKEFQPK